MKRFCLHTWAVTHTIAKTGTAYEVCPQCGARRTRPLTDAEVAHAGD